MSKIVRIVEDKDFKNSFYRKIEEMFIEMIVEKKINPFIIEHNKVELIVENGKYKRDEKKKPVKKIIKGISLTTKEEWEREYGRIDKNKMYTGIFVKKNLLILDESSNSRYNFKLEWNILKENKEDFRTIKEYVHIEKLGDNFDLSKIKIDSGIDNFGIFQNRAIVPEEMILAKMIVNFEQDIKFEKEKNKFEGARGLEFAVRGYLKIEGEKDKLIDQVYNLVTQ